MPVFNQYPKIEQGIANIITAPSLEEAPESAPEGTLLLVETEEVEGVPKVTLSTVATPDGVPLSAEESAMIEPIGVNSFVLECQTQFMAEMPAFTVSVFMSVFGVDGTYSYASNVNVGGQLATVAIENVDGQWYLICLLSE